MSECKHSNGTISTHKEGYRYYNCADCNKTLYKNRTMESFNVRRYESIPESQSIIEGLAEIHKEDKLKGIYDGVQYLDLQDKGLLGEMFLSQLTLQLKLATHKPIAMNTEYMTEMCLGVNSEIHECLRHIPWKSWKKSQKLDLPKLQDEIVDAWQFLINLTMAAGIGITDLRLLYKHAIDKNYKRIKEGY